MIKKVYQSSYKSEDQICIARLQVYGSIYIEDHLYISNYEITRIEEVSTYNSKGEFWSLFVYVYMEEKKKND